MGRPRTTAPAQPTRRPSTAGPSRHCVAPALTQAQAPHWRVWGGREQRAAGVVLAHEYARFARKNISSLFRRHPQVHRRGGRRWRDHRKHGCARHCEGPQQRGPRDCMSSSSPCAGRGRHLAPHVAGPPPLAVLHHRGWVVETRSGDPAARVLRCDAPLRSLRASSTLFVIDRLRGGSQFCFPLAEGPGSWPLGRIYIQSLCSVPAGARGSKSRIVPSPGGLPFAPLLHLSSLPRTQRMALLGRQEVQARSARNSPHARHQEWECSSYGASKCLTRLWCRMCWQPPVTQRPDAPVDEDDEDWEPWSSRAAPSGSATAIGGLACYDAIFSEGVLPGGGTTPVVPHPDQAEDAPSGATPSPPRPTDRARPGRCTRRPQSPRPQLSLRAPHALRRSLLRCPRRLAGRPADAMHYAVCHSQDRSRCSASAIIF